MKGTMTDFPLRLLGSKNEQRRLMLPGPAGKINAHLKTDGSNSCSKSRRVGPKISEAVKWKVRLGVKIIRGGGVEKMFRREFRVREGEKLIKASQCYLSTTQGPMAGLVFISTHKIAFCRDRLIKLPNPMGETVSIYYKVVIPLEKINRVGQTENVKRPSDKYLQLVTTDEFEFWLMGIVGYKTTFNCLDKAIRRTTT